MFFEACQQLSKQSLFQPLLLLLLYHSPKNRATHRKFHQGVFQYFETELGELMWFEIFKFHLNLCTLYKRLRRDCSHCDATLWFWTQHFNASAPALLQLSCQLFSATVYNIWMSTLSQQVASINHIGAQQRCTYLLTHIRAK